MIQILFKVLSINSDGSFKVHYQNTIVVSEDVTFDSTLFVRVFRQLYPKCQIQFTYVF